MLVFVLIMLGLAIAPGTERPVFRPETADLLFTSGRDGNSEIYLVRAGAPEWINLTKHASGDNWPIWSPDGTRVVYQNNRSGKLDIWTMAADGSNQVPLTDHPEPDYLPAWSPDGKRIVYSRKGKDNGADVFVAGSDGANERRVTNDQSQGIYNGSPTFSPDGKSIAFYSDNGTVAALTVIKMDGTGRRTLAADGLNWYPRWSPDGSWLVYTASASGGEKGNVDIFAVPTVGDGKPILLVGGAKRELEGSWRPTP